MRPLSTDTSGMVSLNQISARAELERRRYQVEEALEEFVQKRLSQPDAPVMRLVQDVLLGGGKRYRPILAVLAYEACGGEDREKAFNLALSGELIHTATLIHDDINDRSKLRRGKPTLHTTTTQSHAIIAGDYLFALGFGIGGHNDDRVVERIASTCGGIATGEIMQMEHIGNLSTTPEDYYAIVDGKTARPFASACWGAAIAAEVEHYADPMEEFGMELGRAFQLVDDILDLTGDPMMGKPRGTDVHDGKMTLPIIHALTMLHGSDYEHFADVLKNFGDERWGEFTELIEKAGSFHYVRQLIENHIERALAALEILPESRSRTLMAELTKMSERRRT